MVAGGGTVQVAVVDDDPLCRQILAGAIGRLRGARLAASAPNLEVARSKLARTPVDLVLLSVAMGKALATELLSWLREQQPQATIVLLAGGGGRGYITPAEAALMGASRLLTRPAGPDAERDLDAALERIVAALPGGEPARARGAPRVPRRAVDLALAAPRELVAVGASTGGPPVLLRFLRDLPRAFSVPVVITQHMPAEHVPPFADSLSRESGRQVVVARDGDPVVAGRVYIAGDNRHLKVLRRRGVLVLAQDDGPEENYCRPAVDPMFRSVAEACGATAIGVVMTGMGSDGAKGAVLMRARGAQMVVQDAETSAVWGMPGAVCAAGVACTLVPAARLAPTVASLTSGHLREAP